MKKILFLFSKAVYPNPNNEFFLKVFLKKYKCTFFGPGYTSNLNFNDTLKKLEAIEKNYDFIISNPCILTDDYINLYKHSIIYFNKLNVIEMKKAMKFFFINSKKKKLFFVNFDYHDPPFGLIDNLDKSNSYIITPGLEFLKKTSIHYVQKYELAIKNTNFSWYNYLKNNKKKIISFPFFLDHSEFIKKNTKKKFELNISGVNYYYRQKFLNQINNNLKFKIYKGKYITKFLWKLMSYIKSRKLVNFFRYNFTKNINLSKISFTCGSILDYPVRKFLEIPAANSLLICVPFKGYKNFGFKNNYNFIIVNFKKVNLQLIKLLRDRNLMNKIKKNAYKLIKTRHTVSYRSKMIKLSLKKIEKGTFKGSVWKNGQFIVL